MGNNIKELREALANLYLSVSDYYGDSLPKSIKLPLKLAKEALAAPPRNCDVGSVEEQGARFKEFCGDTSKDCIDCPIKKQWHKALSCGVIWAQMPYESEDK